MTIFVGQDTAKTRKTLSSGSQSIAYYSIPAAQEAGLGDFSNLPAALKVVLENMLRFEDGKTVTVDDIKAFAEWGAKGGQNPREIAYRPARVLMQDFTGVPAVVDLAAMRDGLVALGGDADKINPLNPVDLVIDHSVMIDEFGNPRAFQMNVDREYERNIERYTFLKWGQKAFNNFRVVPPGTGICHQVNLEYLAQTVWTDKDQDGVEVAYPDTLVGTDSHTTMVNGMAVLGWGVGGIEAEAAMLGQPISMLIPEVIGFELTGAMMEGTTGTDLVLKVVEMLREKGVVGKFVNSMVLALIACPWRTARQSPTWPPNTVRPVASSRSTPKPCVTCAPPAVMKTASRWSKPMPRKTACGAAMTMRRFTPTHCRSTWAPSCLRSRVRSVRKTTLH
jgi:aconitate hydratase